MSTLKLEKSGVSESGVFTIKEYRAEGEIDFISLIRMHPGGTEIPESYTPSQIEYALVGDEAMDEEWREIHELYEKARFAPRQVNRSDLKRMRELVRRRGEEASRRKEMKKRNAAMKASE